MPRELKLRRLVSVLACTAVLALTVSAHPVGAAPVAAPSAGFGFSMYGGDVQLSPAELDREFSAVSKTSATWVRVILDAFRIEPADGQFDWSYADLVIAAATAHNLRVLVTLSFSPTWALPPGSEWSAPPERTADFTDFVSATVARYGDRVTSWEIWNEPNQQRFFTFGGDVAARYVDILRASYTAIKAAQPSSTVITGGLSRAGEIPPPDFFEQLYEHGAQGYFDAAAMHPYVSLEGLAADPYHGWSDVGRVHDIMAAHGDGDKRIWLTELGAPTIADGRGVSQDEQAKQILDVLGAAANTAYSGPAFIFTIRDQPAGAVNPEYSYGALLTTDWAPKLAAGVL